MYSKSIIKVMRGIIIHIDEESSMLSPQNENPRPLSKIPRFSHGGLRPFREKLTNIQVVLHTDHLMSQKSTDIDLMVIPYPHN